MKINDVIRKYRKEKNMTQEEMANKLGVTAPAVNKWESGASLPDISLLAPIARLLGVSLDELLSYNEHLSDIEVKNIIKEIYAMFETGSTDTVYQKIVEIVREYPNEEKLILQLASILYGSSQVLGVKDREEYFTWIEKTFENLRLSEDEEIKNQATDWLYAFYISLERYEDAEDCLRYYSDINPEKKRKLATIYIGTGRYEEAYKTLEEVMFNDYQRLSVLMYEIFRLAVKTEDFKKAEKIIEKESALAELFEMGEYHKLAGKLEYAIARKDADKALPLIDSLLSNTDTLMDYMKSSLYEHMTFNEKKPAMLDMMLNTQLTQYCNDDAYQFIRDSKGWEEFKAKWC